MQNNPADKNNQNSRQPAMKVQIASHWRGSAELFPRASLCLLSKDPGCGNLLMVCHRL